MTKIARKLVILLAMLFVLALPAGVMATNKAVAFYWSPGNSVTACNNAGDLHFVNAANNWLGVVDTFTNTTAILDDGGIDPREFYDVSKCSSGLDYGWNDLDDTDYAFIAAHGQCNNYSNPSIYYWWVSTNQNNCLYSSCLTSTNYMQAGNSRLKFLHSIGCHSAQLGLVENGYWNSVFTTSNSGYNYFHQYGGLHGAGYELLNNVVGTFAAYAENGSAATEWVMQISQGQGGLYTCGVSLIYGNSWQNALWRAQYEPYNPSTFQYNPNHNGGFIYFTCGCDPTGGGPGQEPLPDC